MVSIPFLLALLTLFNVTQSFEYFIDMERCKTELACYVRASCVIPDESDPPGDPKKLVKLGTKDKLVNNKCDVIVQIKSFTAFRFHIMIQVNMAASENPSDELDTSFGVEIVQKETQFKCSSNGIVEKPGQLTVVPRGKQITSKELIFCSALIIQTGQTIAATLSDPVTYARVYPKVEFLIVNKGKESIIYGVPAGALWNINPSCNDMDVVTYESIDGDYLQSEIDATPRSLKCPPEQKIRVTYDGKVHFPKALYCDSMDWKFENEGDAPVTVNTFQAFEAFCARAFSELCAPLKINDCDGCTTPPLTDHKIACEDDKWRMTDGSVVVSKVECKQRGNERASGWFMKFNDKEITEGACSKEWNCPIYSKLDFSLPSANATEYQEALKQEKDKEISCTSNVHDLMVKSPNGATRNVSTLSCNVHKGTYTIAGTQDSVEPGSNVFCQRRPVIIKDESAAVAAANSMMKNWAMGGAFTFVAIALIAGVVFFFVRRRYKYNQYIKQKYPDGMMTAREMDDEKYELVKEGGYRLVERTASGRQKYRERKKKEEAPPPAPYNIPQPIHEFTSEIMPREGEFVHWKVGTFMADIFPNIHRYSLDNRLKCFRSLTAFYSYSALKPRITQVAPHLQLDQEELQRQREVFTFGTIDQWLHVIRKCQTQKLHCHETWDSIFRLMKIFIIKIPQENVHMVPLRLRTIMRRVCHEIIKDCGYYLQPDEPEETTGLRLVAARTLMWLKDENLMLEFDKMMLLPLEQIESPIRMVVFSYMINMKGKEKEIREAFEAEVAKNFFSEPIQGLKFGTYRQHLIYALCSAKDTGEGIMGSFSTMKQTFNKIYAEIGLTLDMKMGVQVYTPTDLLYAFRGALEQDASIATAHDQFVAFNPSKADGDHGEKLKARLATQYRLIVWNRTGDAEERKKMIARHKVDILAMMTLIAESCYTEKMFKDVQSSFYYLKEYAVKPDSNFFSENLDEEKLAERSRNVNFLLTNALICFWLSRALQQAGFPGPKDID